MKVTLIDTRGTTQISLTVLRNELARRIDHYLTVIQLDSADSEHVEGYGLMLLDFGYPGRNPELRELKEAVVIGDGFRGDGAGEGGAGDRAAQAMLSLYGLEHALPYEERIDFIHDWNEERMLEIAKSLKIEKCSAKRPLDRRAQYIDYLSRR